MTMENQMNILGRRTECIPYYAEPSLSDEHRAGWIGGNAPEFFDDQTNLIHAGDWHEKD
ncbi:MULTISPECIES: hypothetical protein [Paenibacillus]|uniref:Uncharacterized protein n=1 Tax=Paenibacillus albilobatus TaxID=2716884 RepID=A0A919XEI4_9BACL|nr:MULTISPECIES: hypothetical protein [Paenibacillus]GIO28998.1 hypothetical protein J2TS6_01390 [Paenibacillus albilobatus]